MFIFTLVTQTTQTSQPASNIFVYNTGNYNVDKNSAIEKLHSELAYAYNQNLFFALAQVTNGSGDVIRTEVFNGTIIPEPNNVGGEL